MGVESGQNGHVNGRASAVLDAPIQSGGAPVARALDLTNQKDQAALRTAMTWWPGRYRLIDAAIRDRMTRELMVSLDNVTAAEGMDPTEAERLRQSAVKTLAMMDALQQRDEHKVFDAIMGKSDGPTTNIQVNAENVSLKAAFR